MTPATKDSPDGFGDPTTPWPALRFPGDDGESDCEDGDGDGEPHICRSID